MEQIRISECVCIDPFPCLFFIYIQILDSNQLLGENKLYSLNSTYNLCALKNLQFRFQEKNLNLNRIRTSDLQITSLALLPIEAIQVPIPVHVQTFLLKR